MTKLTGIIQLCDQWKNVHFNNPHFFYAVGIIPLILLYRFFFHKKSTLSFSFINNDYMHKIQGRAHYTIWVILIRIIALLLLITALARPQLTNKHREYTTKGVDIIIALDISGSMKAEDFQPHNRLTVAKEEAQKFIMGRKNDRIGLIIFAQKSFTRCPLTHDYGVLLDSLKDIYVGMIQDGTAIGLAIANAVNRLRDSDAKSKVIILLTDGENNAGQLDPMTAADIARKFGIKIYTIGIGKGGVVPFPHDDPVFGRQYVNVELKIDEDMLQKIAAITGGLYFRARDQHSLESIYKRIDQLEKTEIKISNYFECNELFYLFILAALAVLMLEYVLKNTFFLTIP